MSKEIPLCARLEKAEIDLVNALNAVMQEQGLPCYLLEPIIERIYRAVLDGKRQELAAAKTDIANNDVEE